MSTDRGHSKLLGRLCIRHLEHNRRRLHDILGLQDSLPATQTDTESSRLNTRRNRRTNLLQQW